MEGLISVIVPVYNFENCLQKCVDSILNQSYTNLEVILVNDGSKDQSGKVCDYYAQVDSRVKVIHKKNGGASDARNKGLDAATGEYIGFVDGDDWIEKDFFRTLYELIQTHEADLSMISYNEVQESGVRAHADSDNVFVMERTDAVKQLLFDKRIQNYVWNKLYRKELFEQIRFPAGIIYDDINAMYEIFRSAHRIVYAEQPLYNYLIRSNSIVNSGSHQKRVDELDSVIKRYEDVKRDFPELEKENAYALVMWMIRVYTYTVKENDPDDAFIREQYTLFQSEAQKYLCYILPNLKPFKRMILLAMLWDLEKGKEVVRMDGVLHG